MERAENTSCDVVYMFTYVVSCGVFDGCDDGGGDCNRDGGCC